MEKTINGTIYCYNKKGQIHCLNGPAIITRNGHKYWLINNKLHREDGPSCEFANGQEEWHYNGVKIGSSKNEFTQEKFERWLKLKAFQ